MHLLTKIAPASSLRLKELHEATKNDPTLQLLAQITHQSWPRTIQDCPHSIQSYWYFRDEITIEDGILYKGTRLIIPQTEQNATQAVLHMGHYATDKMNLRARETVYWPSITDDIKITYKKCTICAKHAKDCTKRKLCDLQKHQQMHGKSLD